MKKELEKNNKPKSRRPTIPVYFATLYKALLVILCHITVPLAWTPYVLSFPVFLSFESLIFLYDSPYLEPSTLSILTYWW